MRGTKKREGEREREREGGRDELNLIFHLDHFSSSLTFLSAHRLSTSHFFSFSSLLSFFSFVFLCMSQREKERLQRLQDELELTKNNYEQQVRGKSEKERRRRRRREERRGEEREK